MGTYDEFLAHQRAFFDNLDVAHDAKVERLVREWNIEREQQAAHYAALLSEHQKLRAAYDDLVAEQDPWEEFYSTDFTDNDGWEHSTINKAHDDARALPRNVRFTPEGLMLDTKRETTTSSSGTRYFTSGETRKRIGASNYFRARVVASAPHEVGLRPCPLWFRPLGHPDGEIDVMENFGAQPRAMATLHTEYGSTHKMIHGPLKWPKAPDALYVYEIFKTPGRIFITVDGITMLDAGPASPNGVPDGWPWARIFEQPDRLWYPRISTEVGCGNRGDCNTGTPDSTFQQATMNVKELKIWNLKAA